MKRIALLLSVTLVGCAALSYWNGLRIERSFQEEWQRVVDAGGFPPDAMIENRYERGLFRSRAHAKFRPSTRGPAIVVENEIAHGPIPWAGLGRGAKLGRTWIATDLHLKINTPPALAQALTNLPPFQIRSHLESNRSGTSEFHWDAFETHTPDGGRLSLQALDGSLAFGGPREQATGSLEWGGLRLESPQFSVEMSPLRGEFAYEDVLQTSVYGQSSFSLDRVEAVAGGQAVATLQNLQWSERRAVQDERLFLQSKISLASLQVMNFLIRELSLESQFENIDLGVWGEAQKALRSLHAGGKRTRLTGGGDTEPMSPAHIQTMLRRFVAANPSLSIEGEAQVNDELVSVAGNVQPGGGPLPDSADLEVWGRTLDADLSLRVPSALLEPWLQGRGKKATQLRALVDQRILRRTPNAYETQLQYEGGALRINGVPADALRTLGRPSS